MHARSDGLVVGTGAATLPRVAAAAGAILLVSATISLAADTRASALKTPAKAHTERVLIVPDVRHQVFVFAKGTLEDSGFGWQVKGATRGYAANRVVSQVPRPGARVVDTGAPKITLQLERNYHYAQLGVPEDVSPYGASLIRSTAAAVAHAKVLARVAANERAAAKTRKDARLRTPAFVVRGAPKEPLGEPTLPARAQALAEWFKHHHTASAANNQHWISAHAWIVTGARFGWWGGAQALATLIQVDRQVESAWRVGSGNRELAMQALREVQAKSKQA